jgi:hypothetical protein
MPHVSAILFWFSRCFDLVASTFTVQYFDTMTTERNPRSFLRPAESLRAATAALHRAALADDWRSWSEAGQSWKGRRIAVK